MICVQLLQAAEFMNPLVQGAAVDRRRIDRSVNPISSIESAASPK
jgi:hypothetical protein